MSRFWPALIVSLALIRTHECRVACLYKGYDDGFYRANKCFCVEIFDYQAVTQTKRLTSPRKSAALVLPEMTDLERRKVESYDYDW